MLNFELAEYSGTLKYYTNSISGIWNSYGCIPQDGEGISLFVEESSYSNDSLINLCGFDTTRKNIGALADSRTIEELIVMLPMMQDDLTYTIPPPSPPVYVPLPDKCAPCDEMVDPCEDDISSDITKNEKEKFKGLTYCRTEDAWLFTINPNLINEILSVEDYKKISVFEVQSLLDKNININHENNIVKLIKSMVKYNIPPHLNWLAFPNEVPPYAFYVAEFSSKLNKKDLGDIWQGTMPTVAEVPEEEEITIEHYLTEEEIFGGYNITEYDGIKLKIFKCKKRAANNYNTLIKKEETYKSLMGGKKGLDKWYQYNWPYDNFSLVELLKVEAGEIHEFTYDGISSGGNVIKTFTNEDGSQTSFSQQVTGEELSNVFNQTNGRNEATGLYVGQKNVNVPQVDTNKLYTKQTVSTILKK